MMHVDVTAQVNAQVSAQPFLQTPFREVLDELPDAIAVFTAAEMPVDRQIVYVNEAFVRLSGYTAEQLLGRSPFLLAGAHPDFQYLGEIQRVATDDTVCAVKRKFRPDGTTYDVQMWLSPLRCDGAVTHCLLRERDVSGRDGVRSDAEGRRLLAESMMSMCRLAAGVAYELESPLGTVEAHLNAVLRALESGSDREVAPAVRYALAEAQRASNVVRGLKAFVDPDEEQTRALDVHEAIETALKLTKVAIDRRATLVRRYGLVPPAMASLRRLTHALVAILRNAASAIPIASPHGAIEVDTSTTPDGYVAIAIHDNGVGILKEELAYAFDPFFTIEPHHRSLGLGLAAARAAVVEMGGAISMESVYGRGTRVRIVLPACADGALRAASAPTSVTAPTPRVLCVAMTPADAGRIEALFEATGANALFARFEDAIEELALRGPYDLVVCDGPYPERGAFRKRLRDSAPGEVAPTVEADPAPSSSGIFQRPSE